MSSGWNQQDVEAFTALFMMLFISAVGLRGSVSLSAWFQPTVTTLKPAVGRSQPRGFDHLEHPHRSVLCCVKVTSSCSRLALSIINLFLSYLTKKNEEYVTEEVSRL